MNNKLFFGVVAALVLAISGCGKKEDPAKPPTSPTTTQAPSTVPTPAPAGVTVSTISLGSAVGADKKVAKTADSFSKQDTIYASVDTTGAGTATLKAKWTYRKGGQEALVKEDSQTISATGPATSEFHISKPDGWPEGDYQIEIFVNDKSAGTKSFTVK